MGHFRALAIPLALLAAAVVGASSVRATTYNEGTSGDLSNNQLAPTPLTLTLGTNPVIGNVNGGTGDSQDWIALTVPAGDKLSSIMLASYVSTDVQGFTGFGNGSTFVPSPFIAGSYVGYTHFGTGAGNGALPPTNLVGTDLMPLMADPTLAAGATGFTPPLGSGTYTFLIQQLGASTNYEFDYNVTAAPEPSSLLLLGSAGAALLRFGGARRRRNG